MNGLDCFFKIQNTVRSWISQLEDTLKSNPTEASAAFYSDYSFNKYSTYMATYILNTYLKDEFDTSNSLEGEDKEGLEALSLTYRVTLELPD